MDAATQALISEAVAEASASGELTADPPAPAPTEPSGEVAPADPAGETEVTDEAEGETPEAEGDEDSQPEAESAEETDGAADAAEPVEAGAVDVDAIAAAIDAEDPDAFLAALGDHAKVLLGAKAHRALRRAGAESKRLADRANQLAKDLQAKYGDPVAAARAATAGDLNPFLDHVERVTGLSWTELVTQANQIIAGRKTKLEATAVAKGAAEAAAKVRREEAATQIRQAITELATRSEARLLKAHPKLVDQVFDRMREGYHRGVTTPAKALAEVKRDLLSQTRALQRVFVPSTKTAAAATPAAPTKAPAKPATKLRPPSEDVRPEGRKATDAELRREALREVGQWSAEHERRYQASLQQRR
jgi:hypothetical protein